MLVAPTCFIQRSHGSSLFGSQLEFLPDTDDPPEITPPSFTSKHPRSLRKAEASTPLGPTRGSEVPEVGGGGVQKQTRTRSAKRKAKRPVKAKAESERKSKRNKPASSNSSVALPVTPIQEQVQEQLAFNGLNPKVQKFGSPVEGFGLRTSTPMKAGEVVWQGPSPFDRPYPVSEVKTWSEEKWKEWRHYLYQVGDDLWGPKDLTAVQQDDANFLNHSCNPNVWFDGPFRHVAMRDIEAGEELFYDYGVENLEDDDFVCLCRQPNCRGIITKNDWKLPSVQQLHGDHMTPHVLKLVKAMQQEQAEALKEQKVKPDEPPSASVPEAKEELKVKLDEPPSASAEKPLGNGLSPKVVKFGSSIEGFGLKTIAPMVKGEVVWQGPSPFDRPYPVSEVKSWSEEKWKEWRHYLYQIGDDLWGPKDLTAVEQDDANFLNHSCNPNVWFDGPFRHVALRDIEAGEELTYDYGVENLEDDDFKCLCGAATCRGVITKYDWMLESVQKFHGEHMAPHVLKLIKERNEQVNPVTSPSSDSEDPEFIGDVFARNQAIPVR